MTQKADERRHFARVLFDADASLITTEARYAAQLIDVSLKGALVEIVGASEVEPGEPCLLAVRLGELTIKMSGDIAHIKGTQVGVQCRCIDLESISHLRRLIEVNLGGGKLLEREFKALLTA